MVFWNILHYVFVTGWTLESCKSWQFRSLSCGGSVSLFIIWSVCDIS